MNIAALSHPPDVSESCVPATEEELPVDRIGQYSVADECFLWSAARELEQRCQRHHLAISPNIALLLRLQKDAQNARSMAEALLAINDLEERRAVVCQMVHEIVRLK
ncbi:hypothetical protein AUJ46_02845 [Candidatus Peregrinibacteria bacterium CG1_02_54_53]|nr:MAG: hypothetical protein AUJ46_02845 [Candidatus Peregrinibacteria bacterium CG1_02_54_53]